MTTETFLIILATAIITAWAKVFVDWTLRWSKKIADKTKRRFRHQVTEGYKLTLGFQDEWHKMYKITPANRFWKQRQEFLVWIFYWRYRNK